ncbi:hypothetical protein D1872_296010 [compost metagenome]
MIPVARGDSSSPRWMLRSKFAYSRAVAPGSLADQIRWAPSGDRVRLNLCNQAESCEIRTKMSFARSAMSSYENRFITSKT